MKKIISLFTMFMLIIAAKFAVAQSPMTEQQVLEKNAAHDQIRRDDFARDRRQKRTFEADREKNKEEQVAADHKYEQEREAGLASYLKLKKQEAISESPAEKKIDDATKLKYEKKYDEAREEYVKIKKRFGLRPDTQFEMEEYGLDEDRPRYAQSDRLKSKWLGKSKNQNGSSDSGSNNFGREGRHSFVPSNNNQPSSIDQYQPNNDYIPPPPETFEDIPPPPPPIYDSGQAMPYDSGYGEPLPPPPPPMIDSDF